MLSLVFHRWGWIWLVIFSVVSSGCWWNCSIIILCSRSQSLCPTWWIIIWGMLSLRWWYFNGLERSVMMMIWLMREFMIRRMWRIDMNTWYFTKRRCPRSVYIGKCSVCIWMMTTGSHSNSWAKWRRWRGTVMSRDIFRSQNLRRLHFNGYCGTCQFIFLWRSRWRDMLREFFSCGIMRVGNIWIRIFSFVWRLHTAPSNFSIKWELMGLLCWKRLFLELAFIWRIFRMTHMKIWI